MLIGGRTDLALEGVILSLAAVQAKRRISPEFELRETSLAPLGKNARLRDEAST